MSHPNASTALARVVIDELSRVGVDLVVISPGSRSAALAIAASTHPDLETRVVLDERSAAFHALGAAKASRRPTAVVSTSGTAPTNFFPAVVEADLACVPLVVISADRPVEMQGVGANQTIDQVDLFGSKVRSYLGIEAPDATTDLNAKWRSSVSGLTSMAKGPRPGPVHLNVRFREPTVPVTDDGRTRGEVYPFETPPRETVEPSPVTRTPGGTPHLKPDRGLVIAGDGEYDRDRLEEEAGRLRWPVLATALSGLRGRQVVSTYHHILAPGVPEELRPEVVVAVGAIGPSARVETLVSSGGSRVRVDLWGRVIDPARNATAVVAGEVCDLLAEVAGSAKEEWRQAWMDSDASCLTRIERQVRESNDITSAGVAVTLNQVDWGSLVVASSLPIRDVDAFLTRPGPVIANRGASGIDGFVSTALGVAGQLPRTLALTGDLSLLHDSNGFLNDADIDLVMIVVDNGGGGLFDLLPQERHAPDYERLFVTDQKRDFTNLARLHDLRYDEASDLKDLRRLADEALNRDGLDLIRVPVDRSRDAGFRAQLDS